MISDHPLRRRQQIVKRAIGAIVALLLFTYLNNTSQFSSPRSGSASVFAHRGVGQRYDIPIESNTCTATHLLTPEHEYLENLSPLSDQRFSQGIFLTRPNSGRTSSSLRAPANSSKVAMD